MLEQWEDSSPADHIYWGCAGSPRGTVISRLSSQSHTMKAMRKQTRAMQISQRAWETNTRIARYLWGISNDISKPSVPL